MSALFIILVLPFMPFFAYPGIIENAKSNYFSSQKVLGEERNSSQEAGDNFCSDEKNSDPIFFPVDQAALNGLPPIRKSPLKEIKIWAGSSVAIDVDSGTILQYDNGRRQTQIASLTKIMTALIVMEKVNDLEEEVTITKGALQVDGTVVGCPTSVFCNGDKMVPGEKLTVKNLMKAMLMVSANDAATALAIHVSGNELDFINLMNRRAKELGLKDTNFCTPSGLEIDGEEAKCFSSAYDIARIAAHSLKYREIWDIMRIPEETIFSVDALHSHNLKNTDLLLSEIPECLGGKTGFTPMAGKSLLLATTDPQKKARIIAVILNDPERWTDMKRLVGWIFENYEWR